MPLVSTVLCMSHKYWTQDEKRRKLTARELRSSNKAVTIVEKKSQKSFEITQSVYPYIK